MSEERIRPLLVVSNREPYLHRRRQDGAIAAAPTTGGVAVALDALMRERGGTWIAHGSGSDPSHSGFLDHFSNRPGSEATSNGAYTTAETYHGKYGLSMKVRGLDWSNNNAESRAIVIRR